MKAQDLTELLESGEKTPDEICPVLYAMSILGPLITNIMLTQALRELERSHLVDRLNYDTIPPHVEYSLSERGKTLIPILKDIHTWGKDQMEIVAAQTQKR